MSKNDKQHALVPRLRFPEFRDSQGWPLVPLQQVAARITARNSDESTTRVLTNSAEHGVVDQRDYFDKDIATQGNLGNYYVVEHGDYVYNPRVSAAAPVGPISRNNIDQGVMSPLYTVFRFNHSDTDFYAHYFKSTSWHSYLRSVSSTGARHDRMSITNGDFMRMPVPEPQPAEQRKIADCLGSLDDLIAAEGRKLAALRDHKKGLMQQIFPREGETRPRLRFPEFQDAGEWKRDLLGNIAAISKGRGLAKSDVDADGETPCIRYGELYTIYGEVIEEVSSRTNLPVADLVLSQTGDVIIPASGETKEDIATCACVMSAGVALGSDLNIIRSPVDGRFFSYYLNGNRRRELAKVAQGDTVAHLYPTQLSMLELYIPVEGDEQHRIADCLSALDAMISAQAEKLDALRTHKRGLIQQLFPSPEDAEA